MYYPFILASMLLASDIPVEVEPVEVLEVVAPAPIPEDVLPSEPPKKVSSLPPDVIFMSSRSTRKEPMVQEEIDEECAIDLVSIAEVGPFSPFKMIGKAKKTPIEVELMEPTRADLEMIYFPPDENLATGFSITARYISNREYEAFVDATHHRPPPNWPDGKIPDGLEDEPVVNVTYKDAFLFAIWSGKRLPKETELNYALNNSDPTDLLSEWTSTPSLGSNKSTQNRATINSELSRITYHRVFNDPVNIRESNYYSNTLGFRVALSTP